MKTLPLLAAATVLKDRNFSPIDGRLTKAVRSIRGMTTETQTETRRRYPRISLPKGMFVAWYGGGEQKVSRVKTLGMGGLFVAEPEAPSVGTKLRLSFEVPGGNVHVEAVVRNVTPGEGMGIEFTKLNTRDRVLMEILLRRLFRQIPD